MALKKSEKRLLMLLGVAVAVFVFDKFILGGDKKPPPDPKKMQTVQTRSGDASSVQTQERRKTAANHQAVQYESWGRDPFMPVVNETVQESSVRRSLESKHKLKGILWNEGRAYVLIDDLVLSEGESKEGILLRRISGNAAYCSKGGRTFTLRMEEK
ncbi:MAG TPA: hypothetical protein ENN03_02100 [bacterium]|nr:hypothetical protein [bacterium]